MEKFSIILKTVKRCVRIEKITWGEVSMYYPKMIGEKCYLSVINPEDYERYTSWVNDMEVAVGVGMAHKLITQTAEKEILERLATSEYNFAIIDKMTDQVIGNVGVNQLDFINQCAEVGIFIGDKAYWSNGYGREALSLLLDFGFNILNLYNIRLGVFGFNQAAISCYQKLGFKEAGRIRGARKIAGTRYDLIYMDMIASEYESIYVGEIIKHKEQLR